LRQPEVEPATPDVVTHGARGSRVTPWQRLRSGHPEPQAGKRQRNGARAAGAGTRSGAAGAHPRISRAMRRA
jgi:hypothetical protein